jgi:hypothetical protein
VTFPDAWKSSIYDKGVESISADNQVYFAVEATDSSRIETSITEALQYLQTKGVNVDESSLQKDSTVTSHFLLLANHFGGGLPRCDLLFKTLCSRSFVELIPLACGSVDQPRFRSRISRSPAAHKVLSRLAKWNRMRLVTGSAKKLEPGTAATPISRANQ